MAATSKRATVDARIPARSGRCRRVQPLEPASSRSFTRYPVVRVLDDLRHRSAPVGDDWRPAGHRLDDAEPEGFVEVDQVQQCVGAAQHFRSLGRRDRPQVPHPAVGEMGLDLGSEVLLVLDDPGDVEPSSRSVRHVDRVRRALVGMDPSEEQQVVIRRCMDAERVGVDAVVDRRCIVQPLVAVGVADRDVVVGGVVPLVDRQDPRRREAVNGRDNGRVHHSE